MEKLIADHDRFQGSTFTTGIFTTPDVTAALRGKNNPTLSTRAYLVRMKAATLRIGDYIEAASHAHETGNLDECTGLAIALSGASRDLAKALDLFDRALEAEKSVVRAAA